MEIQKISLDKFSSFSSLVGDYLSSDKTHDFFPLKFSIENVINLSKQRNFDSDSRKILISALKDQYKKDGVNIDSDLLNSIDELENENTFTVVTGHQLGLFTGPLYFVIKILHAIKLAELVNSKQKDIKVLPVFWMATEDHDFEEINHAHIFNQTFTWEDEKGGKVGAYSTKSLKPLINELSMVLGDSENAIELRSIIENSYTENDNLASATRKLVHALFNKWNVLIIDGDDKALKTQCVTIFTKEIVERTLFNNQQETLNQFPQDAKVQVNPREINLFYLREGQRNLIEASKGVYVLKDDNSVKWNEQELLEEIRTMPENFSPNVVLRPVYQEKILPNLCYVGGPAEISYWLQLKSSFAAFKVSFPILNLRNSILWMDKVKMKKLFKLEMAIEDLFESTSDINKKLADFEETDNEIDKDINEINLAFNHMATKIEAMDASMKPYILSEGRKIEKQLEQLKSKLLKTKKAKNEERVNSFWNLHEKVFPEGNLHERYDNFVPYFIKYGRSFFDHIFDSLDPSDPRLIVIKEN